MPAFAFADRLGLFAVIGTAGRPSIGPVLFAGKLGASVGQADGESPTLNYAQPSFGTFRFSVPQGTALSLGFTQVFD